MEIKLITVVDISLLSLIKGYLYLNFILNTKIKRQSVVLKNADKYLSLRNAFLKYFSLTKLVFSYLLTTVKETETRVILKMKHF